MYRHLPEVDHSLITLVNEDRPLGRGAFGRVFLGRLYSINAIDSLESAKLVEVAVKIASGICSSQAKLMDIQRTRAPMRNRPCCTRRRSCVVLASASPLTLEKCFIFSLQTYTHRLHARLRHHHASLLLDSGTVRG